MRWDDEYIEDVIDTSHWIHRGATIANTPNEKLIPILEQTELELRKLLKFVNKVPVSGMDFGTIRLALFIPFGGPELWNRKVSLLLREIEYANDRHCGQGTPVPDWEWTLSGLDRPVEVERRPDVGDGGGPPDLLPNDMAPDKVLVE